MKRLVLRISALAAVVLLGWIAIAYAQRQNDSTDGQASDAGRSTIALGGPDLGPPAVITDAQLNPLRGSQDPPAPEEIAPANYPPVPDYANEPSGQAVAAGGASTADVPPDPFGLQTVQPRSTGNAPTTADAPPAPQRNTHDAFDDQQPDYAAPPADSRAPSATQQYPTSTGYDNGANQFPTSPAISASSPTTPQPFQGEAASAPLADYGAASNGTANDYSPGREPGYGASAEEGTGRPATDRRFEGPQSPQLSIQKIAPEEIQVGKPAVFRIEVKNTGPVAAQNVEIRDQIPQGTRLIDTKPAAQRGARGELVWDLEKIEPGSGASVEMQIMPTAEGEIGSVATISFSAAASTRCRCTKPALAVNVSGPQTVMIEESMTLSITISNPGSGKATGVVIEEHVPACFEHPAGAELEYEVGDLAPNETKTLDLKLKAVRPGQTANLLIARADAVEEIKKQLPIEVVAPQLKVELSGPRSRYLERQATYEVAVSNPGTASAHHVRLSAELPEGLKFVSANNNGHYDPQTRTVQWALAELPTGETGTVQLTTLPVEIGRHALQLQTMAEKTEPVKEVEQILVDGIAAIRFEVVDVQDPIEVGGETTYEVRVLNQGSKEATQVCLAAELPPGLRVVAAEGPDSLANRTQGNFLIFDPLQRLSPKVDVTYRIRVQGSQPGDQRIRVQLTAAELQSPVIKEESTRVFSDK
ncbi:MAG: DUF11 domain-containing protein [Pirellulales bacterium]|nr:DUF11 domain-containing protein [Pirellulales bacterium]